MSDRTYEAHQASENLRARVAELEQQVATLLAGLKSAVACMKPGHRDTPEETATIRKALELLPNTEAV